MRTVYLASVWVHILAAMVWIGGLVVVVVSVMPIIRQIDEPHQSHFRRRFIDRFRLVMWTAFGVVGLTGALNLWLRGVRWEHLADPAWLTSSFGSFASLKIALYLAGGAMAIVHERVASPAAARALGRVTLAVGLAIVFVAVLLVRGA